MGVSSSQLEHGLDVVFGRKAQRQHDMTALTLQLAADKEVAMLRESFETSRAAFRYFAVACGTAGFAYAAWFMYKHMNQRLEAKEFYQANLEMCKLWQNKREFEVSKAIEVGLPTSQIAMLLSGDSGPPLLTSPRIESVPVTPMPTPRPVQAKLNDASPAGPPQSDATNDAFGAEEFSTPGHRVGPRTAHFESVGAADAGGDSCEREGSEVFKKDSIGSLTSGSHFVNIPVPGFSTKASDQADGSHCLEIECPGVQQDQIRIIRLTNSVHVRIEAPMDNPGSELGSDALFEFRHRLPETDDIFELREDEIVLEHGILWLVFRPEPPQHVRLSSGKNTMTAFPTHRRPQRFSMSKASSEVATDTDSVCDIRDITS